MKAREVPVQTDSNGCQNSKDGNEDREDGIGYGASEEAKGLIAGTAICRVITVEAEAVPAGKEEDEEGDVHEEEEDCSNKS